MRKCRDCWTPAQTDYLGLCERCASNPVIVEEKLKARQITKEIRDGLPAFYKKLRGEVMKNKHYEMIVAKASNMDLVVFVKSVEVETGGLISQPVGHIDWTETGERGEQMPCFHEDLDYFLCLPQHKDACLHWLNGGDLIQDSQYVDGKYSDVEASMNPNFASHGDLFMTTERNIRMKPRKEKRWLLVNAIDNFQPRMFDVEDDADHMLQGSHPNWSKREIEVEV